MAKYACFIREALEKTKGRECVPSLEEILVLMQRQEMICTVHCPGVPACSVAISSHTTAEEVSEVMAVPGRGLGTFWCTGLGGQCTTAGEQGLSQLSHGGEGPGAVCRCPP